MARILSVSGSPSATSRTARLLEHLDERLRGQGHEVTSLQVRTLPADALLGAQFGHPAVVDALAGKTVLPLATGGSTAHVLALDYALRPVLNSMGPHHILPGWFTLDRDVTVGEGGELIVAEPSAAALAEVTDRFSVALGGRTVALAQAG
ncbi:NAD(P)H-dependent oxidoreductase [Streptomyces sp. NPDC051684]|uniref:NAD(P)H-dependent oxidoreductase n=1 Tax=Streptomyces sp. NPDC051684 TaxID=3365670 RepID=UPI0037B768E3